MTEPWKEPGTSPNWQWEELAVELTSINEWSHSGIAEISTGAIAVSTPGSGSLSLIYEDRVEIKPLDRGIFHGITADRNASGDILWLADIGVEQTEARVLMLEVETWATTDCTPARSVLPEVSSWRPTSIAVERSAASSNGFAIWVADGYGNSLVHRIEQDKVTLTIDGSESGLAFDCPHGVALDTRFTPPRIVVADRNNQRLVWFSTDGVYLHALSDPLITSPSGITVLGDKLFVTELHGGLISVSLESAVRDELPRSKRSRNAPWPNEGTAGNLLRPTLNAGQLNSPHGICATADGSLVLTEWLIGGRTVRLNPLGRAMAH